MDQSPVSSEKETLEHFTQMSEDAYRRMMLSSWDSAKILDESIHVIKMRLRENDPTEKVVLTISCNVLAKRRNEWMALAAKQYEDYLKFYGKKNA